MNSRKRLLRLFFLVLVHGIFLPAKAQPVIGYSNNIFNITTPAIDSQVIKGNLPYTKVFFETGSGAFYILQTNTFHQATLNQIWYYKQNGTAQTVAQLATYYDTIRRPPYGSSSIINTVNTPGQNTVQNILRSGYIKLTNAVNNTILASDTMTVALTYKNTPQLPGDDVGGYNSSVVAFFYNDTNNPGLFNTVPPGNTPPYNFNGTNVLPIRLGPGQVIKPLSYFPPKIRDSLQAQRTASGYSGAIYILVPYDPANPEKHIFLSLTTSTLTGVATETPGLYKAVLIDYNISGAPSIVKKYEETMVTNLASHDPNFIVTVPRCLGNFVSPVNKKISYKVQFLNDGKATAESIKVVVSIPLGMQFPTTETNISPLCIVGPDTVSVYRWDAQVVFPEKKPRYVRYWLNPDTREITFKIYNSRLLHRPGIFGLNNNVGSIEFSVKTNANAAYVRECMYSKALIYFDDNKAVKCGFTTTIECKPGYKCPPVFEDPNKGK